MTKRLLTRVACGHNVLHRGHPRQRAARATSARFARGYVALGADYERRHMAPVASDAGPERGRGALSNLGAEVVTKDAVTEYADNAGLPTPNVPVRLMVFTMDPT